MTAATIGIMQIDEDIRQSLKENNLNHQTDLLDFGKAWGEPIFTVPLSAGLYLHGLIAEDKATRRVGFEIFQSFFYTGIITAILKGTIGRARPYMELSSKKFRPLTANNDFNSLPSGHTSLAFSLSTILSNNFESDYLKVAAYLPAFITAFSRMSYDKHWLSDVFLGAAIGYFVGNFVHSMHEENNSRIETNFSQFNVLNVRLSLN